MEDEWDFENFEPLTEEEIKEHQEKNFGLKSHINNLMGEEKFALKNILKLIEFNSNKKMYAENILIKTCLENNSGLSFTRIRYILDFTLQFESLFKDEAKYYRINFKQVEKVKEVID